MKLLWGFEIVPTYYAVYIVIDKQNGVLRFVKEFKTRGRAVSWINNYGDKGSLYCVQTHMQRR